MAKVLVVADADWVRDDIVGALARRGLETLSTAVSRDVLDICFEEAPDAVVCDSQVGSMGVIAVCRSIKSAERAGDLALKFVAVLDRRADVFLARRSGADAWLVKPVEPAALRWTVDTLLEGAEWSEAALAAEMSGANRFPDDDVPNIAEAAAPQAR